MRQMILCIFIFVSTALCASSATSFCKCTCKGNSTIIALDPKTSSTSASSFSSDLGALLHVRDEKPADLERRGQDQGHKTHRANTCNDCNRQFCLDYKLPGCKGVRDEEVFTTCFQRDSLKDKAIVFIFIFATAGLLLWAIFKPYAEKWFAKARERNEYTPLSGNEGVNENLGEN